MRRGNAPEFFFDSAGQVVGINLSSDFCSEHEWGIRRLQDEFGVRDSGHGLGRRLMRKCPRQFRWWWGGKDYAGFWLAVHAEVSEPSREVASFYGGRTLSAGWSDRDLGAFSTSGDEIAHLRTIYDAIAAGPPDGALWLGGGGFMQNPGLVLAIASRLPKEVTDRWDRDDRQAEGER